MVVEEESEDDDNDIEKQAGPAAANKVQSAADALEQISKHPLSGIVR